MRVPAGISLMLAEDSILCKRSGSKSGNNFLMIGNSVMIVSNKQRKNYVNRYGFIGSLCTKTTLF
jgi:uncharacterized membrane protein